MGACPGWGTRMPSAAATMARPCPAHAHCSSRHVYAEPKDLRGPRLGACLAALHVLKGRGIGGAFVWALDNSCGCGFQAESALLRIAGEPTGVHAQQQQGQAAGGGAQQAATGGAAASGGGQHVASYSGSTCCCIG